MVVDVRLFAVLTRFVIDVVIVAVHHRVVVVIVGVPVRSVGELTDHTAVMVGHVIVVVRVLNRPVQVLRLLARAFRVLNNLRLRHVDTLQSWNAPAAYPRGHLR